MATTAPDGEIILGRFLRLVRQGHAVMQAAPLRHTVGRDRLHDGREQRLGSEGSGAGVAIRIHRLELEVDVSIAKRLGHVLILEELPLAGGRGELQTKYQSAIAGSADQGIG
ncbi:hypothetical protein D3C85_948340 [compost metagenome]